jgi:hypothetical protein
MLVVALAGLVMGSGVEGYKMWRLSGYYAARARKHENVAIRMRNGSARFKRQADHHESMAVKYERAARYPWLPVDPDPPEPKSPLEVLLNEDVPGSP